MHTRFVLCVLVSYGAFVSAHSPVNSEVAKTFPLVPKVCLHLFEPWVEMGRRAPVTCFQHGSIGDDGSELFAIATRESADLPRLHARVDVRRKVRTLKILDTRTTDRDHLDYLYLSLVTRLLHADGEILRVTVTLPSGNADAREATHAGWTETALGRALIGNGYKDIRELGDQGTEFTGARCADYLAREAALEREAALYRTNFDPSLFRRREL